MHKPPPSSALDYYARQQLSLQWRGFLTALAAELESQLQFPERRKLMAGIGTRFAAAHPLADCATIDALAAELNSLWVELDWGYVEFVDAHDHVDIRHHCAPLAAFGSHASEWVPAFLEGAYQYWLQQAGAHALSVKQIGRGTPHDNTFRLA